MLTHAHTHAHTRFYADAIFYVYDYRESLCAVTHTTEHAESLYMLYKSNKSVNVAASLQVELVFIILHKGSADPLLPSLSPVVVVADMPIAIGSRALGSGINKGLEELRIPLGRWYHLSYPMTTQSSYGQLQCLRV